MSLPTPDAPEQDDPVCGYPVDRTGDDWPGPDAVDEDLDDDEDA